MSGTLTVLALGVIVAVVLGFRIWAEAKETEALQDAIAEKVFGTHLSSKGNKE